MFARAGRIVLDTKDGHILPQHSSGAMEANSLALNEWRLQWPGLGMERTVPSSVSHDEGKRRLQLHEPASLHDAHVHHGMFHTLYQDKVVNLKVIQLSYQ